MTAGLTANREGGALSATEAARAQRARAEEAKKKHGHKPRRHHKHHRKHPKAHHTAAMPATPGGTLPLVLPTPPPSPPAPSAAPVPVLASTLTLKQARRLLWRAGFGPTPGQAEALVGTPTQQAVFSLTRPAGAPVLSGPEPVDSEGNALDPYDVWGDDHCWWLDRMIRSDQQLVEKMTFILHDWFATSNTQVNSQRLMIEQNELFREMALGHFDTLFQAVTVNPAMLLFLNGNQNHKGYPNENYAREMMELFSLGADRGAYTQEDVKENARALTGFTNSWSESLGNYDFRFEPSLHEQGNKTVFGHTGKWNYEDSVRMCVNHPLHPSFFVTKLWGYFIPTPPSEATLASLQGLYLSSEYSIQAVLEAILQHPDLYNGPEMVIPPVVYNAGLLRSIGRYIDTTSWTWLSANAGQQLFYPPNVSGWDFGAWLDTSTARARWEMASEVTSETYANPWPPAGKPVYNPKETPTEALAAALGYWGDPLLSPESAGYLTSFAYTCLKEPLAKWELSPDKAMRQNALRMLIATSPDMQVS